MLDSLKRFVSNEEKGPFQLRTKILGSVYIPSTLFKVCLRYTSRMSNSISGILKFSVVKKEMDVLEDWSMYAAIKLHFFSGSI